MLDWNDAVDRKSRFMASTGDYDGARAVILGAPMDYTVSFRPGSRFGPQAIREVSDGLEEYSVALDRDLRDIQFVDLGDLVLPIGNVPGTLEAIRRACNRVLGDGKTPFLIGGEHLVSFPAVEAAAERFHGLVLLHFDAHADLRPAYMGESLSHASVIRLIKERGLASEVYQFGIRSGDRPEFEFARTHTHMYPEEVIGPLEQIVPRIGDRPVYVTIDIDVVDPAFAPGTGTPEPGGIGSSELLRAVRMMERLQVVGFDLVEVAPVYDPSGATALLGAKIMREALLTIVR